MPNLHITQLKLSKEVVYILLFGMCGGFLLLIVSFYDHKMTRYDQLKIENFPKIGIETKNHGDSIRDLTKTFHKE